MTSRHSASVIASNGFSPPQRGVVDETVDAAETLDRGRHHALHRGRIGDVANAGERPAAGRLDLAHHGVRFRAMFERALTTTAAPPAASSSAIARPMLRPAPVTIATRPSSSCRSRRHPLSASRDRRPAYSRAQRATRPRCCAAPQPPWRAVEGELLLDVRRASAARARRRACAAGAPRRRGRRAAARGCGR